MSTTPMPQETARSSAPLLAALELVPDGEDAFLGTHQVIPSGRAYGGEIVAQAERAMSLTVGDDRRIHSLHGYFLRAGDVDDKTRWEVERLRDGRGFSHRSVRGLQNGRTIFQAIRHAPSALYTAPDGGRGRRQVVWLRAWDRLPDDPDLHRSALTYVCDYTLLEPVLRHHGAAWATDGVVTASLDHAMWWHHDGRLPASVVQEGLVTVP
jgi:acyl-CoA thioesterase-2